jgi:HPt (histidine-containing phosphotransfer) domain-containing protein
MPDSTGDGPGSFVADRTVLDLVVVGRLERLGADTGEDLMGQLTEMFLTDAGVQLDLMREALAQNDLSAVAWSAHMLSGASANLGAVELAGLSSELEIAAAAGELADGCGALESIATGLNRVRVALHGRLPIS